MFGEEAGGDDADTGWLVDPLDGTANFVHGFDAVGVSVGLVADGEPVVGVVHAPLLDRTYCGPQGWRRVPRRAADPRQRPRARAGDRRDRLPVPAQGAAARLRAGVRRRAAPLRGPPPGRRRQPRPVLDRRGRVRRLLRAAARALGRGRRRRSSCGRPAGSSPTGRATTGAWLDDAATSWPGRPTCTRCCSRSPAADRPINRLSQVETSDWITRPTDRDPDGIVGHALLRPNHRHERHDANDDPHVCNPGQCTGRRDARACRRRSARARPVSPRGRRSSLGTAMATKHGRPRRTPVSPP